MRINVYTEELLPQTQGKPFPVCEVVQAKYVSSRTGKEMINYGLRIYLKSHPDLHAVEGRDDDRSAITFWCGDDEKKIFEWIDNIRSMAKHSTYEPRSWG